LPKELKLAGRGVLTRLRPEGALIIEPEASAFFVRAFRRHNIERPTSNIQLPTGHRLALCSMFDVGGSAFDVHLPVGSGPAAPDQYLSH